jgi:hypothetical protein
VEPTTDLPARLSFGATAGLVGTLALQALRSAGQQWLPETTPPIHQEPGEFMVETAEGALPARVCRAVPDWAESTAALGLGLGYGVTFGVLYAAARPRGGSVWSDGIALGVGTWAAGYPGWLPALGLMPPVTEQEPGQIVVPVIQHVAYGVVTVAAYRWLRDSWGRS